jgi:protein-tyrosine phosphatase
LPEFDISEITNYLFVSSFPGPENLEQVRELGIRLIVSLYLKKPDKVFSDPPLQLLWMPIIDSPLTPLPISVFKRGVEAALPIIDRGEKVLAHCKWGIHRSAGMACCILIAKGYSLEDAVELVKSRREVAKPDDRHILGRLTKFELAWQKTASIETLKSN